MSAVDELAAETVSNKAILGIASVLIWGWIFANPDRKVTLKVWKIGVTFKVKDLHAVAELFLGPPPLQVHAVST